MGLGRNFVKTKRVEARKKKKNDLTSSMEGHRTTYISKSHIYLQFTEYPSNFCFCQHNFPPHATLKKRKKNLPTKSAVVYKVVACDEFCPVGRPQNFMISVFVGFSFHLPHPLYATGRINLILGLAIMPGFYSSLRLTDVFMSFMNLGLLCGGLENECETNNNEFWRNEMMDMNIISHKSTKD